VTVKGVPLTDYMESIIVNTVSNNAGKGRKAMDWVVAKLGSETRYEKKIKFYGEPLRIGEKIAISKN
jgi:uncharacterized protein YycO